MLNHDVEQVYMCHVSRGIPQWRDKNRRLFVGKVQSEPRMQRGRGGGGGGHGPRTGRELPEAALAHARRFEGQPPLLCERVPVVAAGDGIPVHLEHHHAVCRSRFVMYYFRATDRRGRQLVRAPQSPCRVNKQTD
jgi:hypothetical protein